MSIARRSSGPGSPARRRSMLVPHRPRGGPIGRSPSTDSGALSDWSSVGASSRSTSGDQTSNRPSSFASTDGQRSTSCSGLKLVQRRRSPPGEPPRLRRKQRGRSRQRGQPTGSGSEGWWPSDSTDPGSCKPAGSSRADVCQSRKKMRPGALRSASSPSGPVPSPSSCSYEIPARAVQGSGRGRDSRKVGPTSTPMSPGFSLSVRRESSPSNCRMGGLLTVFPQPKPRSPGTASRREKAQLACV